MSKHPNPKPTPKDTWHIRYPRRYLHKLARQRAEKLGVPFKITVEDIVIPRVCPVLGIPLMPGSLTNGPFSPTLDRLVPELGYVPGNIHVISAKANTAKNNLTLHECELLFNWYHDSIHNFYKETPND